MFEQWREVPHHSRYMVSTYGDVYSDIVKRNLKPIERTDGFTMVKIDGLMWMIHRLVASAFMEEWTHSTHLRHLDGDRSNNRLDNLKVIGPISRHDAVYLPSTGTKKGVRIRVKETGDVFRSVRDCAAFIGGSHSAIYACLSGDRHSHLGLHFEWF